MQGVDIVWAIKHNHIGDAYFDSDAASFLFTELGQNPQVVQKDMAEDCAASASMVMPAPVLVALFQEFCG